MSNDTYVQGWEFTGNSEHLEASGDPLAFGLRGESIRFSAAVLFKVNALGFGDASWAADGHLWGNVDGDTGWGFRLQSINGDLVLEAVIGTSGSASFVLGNILTPGNVVERLILAVLDVNTETGELTLLINGNRVAQGVCAYAPSAAN